MPAGIRKNKLYDTVLHIERGTHKIGQVLIPSSYSSLIFTFKMKDLSMGFVSRQKLLS